MKHKVITALMLSSLFSLLAGGVAHAYPGMQQTIKPMESTVDLINVLPKTFPIEPVTFNDVDGKTIDFSQFKGKIIMVNMWATWCPPCVRELPAIERLATKFKAEDFVLLPISIDAEGKQQVQPFLNSLGMPNFNSLTTISHKVLGMFSRSIRFQRHLFLINRAN